MPERPRILFVGPDEPGGMGTAMSMLLASPLADRYAIDVVATHRGTGAARRLAVFASGLFRIAWWSLRRRGRIVHVHSTVRGSAYRKSLCVLLARSLRRRVVLHMHSGPGDVETFTAGMGRWDGAFVRRAFAAADVILAVSSASAEAIREGFGVSDVEVLQNPAPEAPPGAGERVSAADPLSVYLGGFANHVKGGEVMVAALARSGDDVGRVLLAGPGELPPPGRALVDRHETISWRGWMEPAEKEEVLLGASIFVLPSTSEGLPMALLEAMSHGLAILATAVGGVPDVIDSEVDGLIVPPGDPQALAEALERLRADADLRGRLGAAARRRAGQLDVAHVAARLDEIYRGLL